MVSQPIGNHELGIFQCGWIFLGPLLQGQTRIAKLKSAYNSVIWLEILCMTRFSHVLSGDTLLRDTMSSINNWSILHQQFHSTNSRIFVLTLNVTKTIVL